MPNKMFELWRMQKLRLSEEVTRDVLFDMGIFFFNVKQAELCTAFIFTIKILNRYK